MTTTDSARFITERHDPAANHRLRVLMAEGEEVLRQREAQAAALTPTPIAPSARDEQADAKRPA